MHNNYQGKHMQDYSLIQTFLAAMVTAALATGIILTVTNQSRKARKAVASKNSDHDSGLHESVKAAKTNPKNLLKTDTTLPTHKASLDTKHLSSRTNRVDSIIDARKMSSNKLSLEDLINEVHARPNLVLQQLNTFYDSDIQDTDAELLTMCIQSLISLRGSMDAAESQLVSDARNQNAVAFSSILKLSQKLSDRFDYMTKQKGDNQTSSYSDPVNQVCMLTGMDIGERDNGIGYYPFERISYILEKTYGDRNFGDSPVYKIVDPTLTQQRIARQSPADSKSVQDHLLSESDHGVDILLQALSNHDYASFCLMKGESHFVSGALVKYEGNLHLIMLDSMDHQPQGDNSATALMRQLLSRRQCFIDDKHVHDQYRCLKENDQSVGLQRDRHNCGPWSVEVLSRLTKDRCLLIAAEPGAFDGLVLEVANTHSPNNWTVEHSSLAGEGHRFNQYQFILNEINHLQNELDQTIRGLNQSQRFPRR